MLIYGGSGGSGDMWAYNPAASTWSQLLPASAVQQASLMSVAPGTAPMASCSCGARSVLQLAEPTSYGASCRAPGSGPSSAQRHRAQHKWLPAVWDTVGKRVLVVDSSGNVTATTPRPTPGRLLAAGRPSECVQSGRCLGQHRWDSAALRRQLRHHQLQHSMGLFTVAGVWTQLTATNPPSVRYGAQAIWTVSTTNSRHDGYTGYANLDDVWSYSVAQSRWQQITAGAPIPPPTLCRPGLRPHRRHRPPLWRPGLRCYLGDVWAYEPTALASAVIGPVSHSPNA